MPAERGDGPDDRAEVARVGDPVQGDDQRVLALVVRGGINLMEAPRPELDRMTNGLNHQGLVLQVPPYEYAHPEDLVAAAHDEGQDPLIVALD
ncbi:RNA methyltransferase substrate-binding domain-containing protein, partial [Streptomyces pseudogriseolus]|uniref:RNA methyltransferase substrate-binding domain-containing protein n=1 Tax=Streptomyces pseudogriseolus TaxID=36817 RepID=UPI003FA16220